MLQDPFKWHPEINKHGYIGSPAALFFIGCRVPTNENTERLESYYNILTHMYSLFTLHSHFLISAEDEQEI